MSERTSASARAHTVICWYVSIIFDENAVYPSGWIFFTFWQSEFFPSFQGQAVFYLPLGVKSWHLFHCRSHLRASRSVIFLLFSEGFEPTVSVTRDFSSNHLTTELPRGKKMFQTLWKHNSHKIQQVYILLKNYEGLNPNLFFNNRTIEEKCGPAYSRERRGPY